jgi:NAD(P)H-hydrate repair Nnr-like enzyme with NAD(P)H-hydrate dehydratase domain
MKPDYWLTQTTQKPLFPEIEWDKPEQKARAGRLGIVGGNKQGFAITAGCVEMANKTGVGETKVLLPASLKNKMPVRPEGVSFSADNQSGGLGDHSLPDVMALSHWASGMLFTGEAGKNSQTAILYEKFMQDYSGMVTITRDAVDLLKNNFMALADRDKTLAVMSFSQLQSMFKGLHYPKILTFSMQLSQLVDSLHKFTITYPICIVTLHADRIVVAKDGQVATMEWDNPMSMWRGEVATKAAVYWLWNENKQLEAVCSSLLK